MRVDGNGDSRWIGSRAKQRFLDALTEGASLDEAAAAGGHSLYGFYGQRRRDPGFKRAWVKAMAESAERERSVYRPNNRRRLQRRRMRHVRFGQARQEVFLNHFAGCGDAREAAQVAGVDHSTVYKRRRKDPVFAAGFDEALEQSYVRLHVEAVRQALLIQKRMRRALDEGVPTGEVAENFELVLKLLDRWDRRNGRIGVRAVAPERRQPLSFDESIALLERKLRNLDIPILQLPPPIAARYDGEEKQGDEGEADGEEEEGGEGEGR